MKIFKILKNDYFRLFVKRESKVVLGKNCSNLWLLTSVLTATFLAIAFSNASLKYLSYKMDDPFINWVDIKNSFNKGDFTGLVYALESDENKQTYHYYSHQSDHYISGMFFKSSFEDTYFARLRFFENMNTTLVSEILNEDNVVNGWGLKDSSEIPENSIGVIVTSEMIKNLGYKEAPSYIYMQRGSSEEAVDYGFKVYDTEFVGIPLPVLAVVDRLPGNVDIIASNYLYKQCENDNEHPFYLAKDIYANNLHYFVPANVDSEVFCKDVEKAASKFTDASLSIDNMSFYMPEIKSFKDGDFVTVVSDYETLDYDVWSSINEELLRNYANSDVHRVFEYEVGEYNLGFSSYVSVHFEDLDMLTDFETFVSSEFDVNIEMSQINAKQNFNAVSAMGNILSWGIIVFAIICIILFIVNLLQSYFQKVKRNLGTFKAFGISNRDLISVYVLIMAAIILSAVVLSVSATWIIQGLLHVFGVLKDGAFDYLLLWSVKTICSIVIIIVASVSTVGVVMRKLLKATPGDLIYDRQ